MYWLLLTLYYLLSFAWIFIFSISFPFSNACQHVSHGHISYNMFCETRNRNSCNVYCVLCRLQNDTHFCVSPLHLYKCSVSILCKYSSIVLCMQYFKNKLHQPFSGTKNVLKFWIVYRHRYKFSKKGKVSVHQRESKLGTRFPFSIM